MSIESGKHIKKKSTLRSDKVNKNQKNLFKMANSLKCLPLPEEKGMKNHVRIAELDSLTSEENLLEDVQ